MKKSKTRMIKVRAPERRRLVLKPGETPGQEIFKWNRKGRTVEMRTVPMPTKKQLKGELSSLFSRDGINKGGGGGMVR